MEARARVPRSLPIEEYDVVAKVEGVEPAPIEVDADDLADRTFDERSVVSILLPAGRHRLVERVDPGGQQGLDRVDGRPRGLRKNHADFKLS